MRASLQSQRRSLFTAKPGSAVKWWRFQRTASRPHVAEIAANGTRRFRRPHGGRRHETERAQTQDLEFSLVLMFGLFLFHGAPMAQNRRWGFLCVPLCLCASVLRQQNSAN